MVVCKDSSKRRFQKDSSYIDLVLSQDVKDVKKCPEATAVG